MTQVRIGDRDVGEGHPSYIVGEIGINHNGSVEIAKELMTAAATAGVDAVKFQKRTPEVCVPRAEWSKPRETPWGTLSYIEYKRRIEFGLDEYQEIDRHARHLGIAWFTSCWDEPSLEFMEQFSPPCYKIASASLTDEPLLAAHRDLGRALILSTGMSTLEQIDRAVKILGRERLVLLHAVSAYPARFEDLNLMTIRTLSERYGVPVGYSGHEVGLAPSVAAVAIGARVIERHITLDRTMWGTDQAASVEPQGLTRLVRDIRGVEEALGDGVKRIVEAELANLRKLRRVA